jgi:hypothetical protein
MARAQQLLRHGQAHTARGAREDEKVWFVHGPVVLVV